MIKNKLSRIMGEKRISVSELTRRTGLNRITVSDLYHEKSSMVALETLNKICNALDCDVCDILSHTKDVP